VLKKIYCFCVFFLVCGMLSVPAFAQKESQKNSSSGRFQIDGTDDDYWFSTPFVEGVFDVSWKQWTLVGEPVLDAAVRWKIDGSSTFHFTDRNGNAVYLNADDVPLEVLKQVDGNDIRIEVRIDEDACESAGLYSISAFVIEFNAGVLGKPSIYRGVGSNAVLKQKGTDNFNVPSSPDWGKLVYHPNMGADKTYVTPEQAKTIVKHGFNTKTKSQFHAVNKLEVNILPVIQYYNDQLKRKRDQKLKKKQEKEKKYLQNRQKEQRQAIAKRQKTKQRQSKQEDDFFTELDDQLEYLDIEKTFQRELAELETRQRQELDANAEEDRKVERAMLAKTDQFGKQANAWRTEVESRTLPSADTIGELVFEDPVNHYRYILKQRGKCEFSIEKQEYDDGTTTTMSKVTSKNHKINMTFFKNGTCCEISFAVDYTDRVGTRMLDALNISPQSVVEKFRAYNQQCAPDQQTEFMYSRPFHL